MTSNIRLMAATDPTTDGISFSLAFAASSLDAGACAGAVLDCGDGETLDLGVICAPTAVTWSEQRALPLGNHAYADRGDHHTTTLQWGDQSVSCTLPVKDAPIGDVNLPELSLFSVRPVADDPLKVILELSVIGLSETEQVRVDGGSGQVHLIAGSTGADSSHTWTLEYGKPGAYTVAVDLLDAEGFWKATLAESSVEIKEPVDEPSRPDPASDEPVSPVDQAPAAISTATLEASPAATDAKPWLPFRYARPLWAWARTYTTAGGSRVSRSLAQGTYLAIRQEQEVGGVLWYETGRFDWIPASSVALMHPSELRGVELGTAQPEPEPEPKPEPTPNRRGRVTANALNVRTRPGVSTANPPIDRLVRNTVVDIYAESLHAGALWYEIGEGSWAHSGYVELIDESPPPEPEPEPEPKPEPETGQGRVTANVLNVRAAPGARADNPPIDKLRNGAIVTIYAETVYSGATWYRIGEDRWVHSGWVQVVTTPPAQTVPAASSLAQADDIAQAKNVTLPVGWVVSSTLTVRTQPGTGTGSVVTGQVAHNQRLDILETRSVGGENWYRIGVDRWVYGGWVGVAREKARPSSIGASERWVGINLSEQTAVAYEGNRPVYAALVATGLPGTATVQGIFRTWWRLTSRKMSGGSGRGYYYLEEVTWTCYFYSGYALHTAYWHDAFGRPRSHGCVNLSPYDAWWLFHWSEPGGANSPAVYVYWR